MRAQTEETPGRPPAGGLAWVLLITVAVCDQLTKFVMEDWLPGLQQRQPLGHPVFENLLYFHYKQNTGVAFSMFAQHPEILTWVVTIALVVIGWYAWQVPKDDRLSRAAFGLILGGAVGNLIDRHTRGYVVDFIDFVFPGSLGELHARFFGTDHFATFNLADTAISIGMGLLILTLLIHRPRHSEAEKKAATDAAAP